MTVNSPTEGGNVRLALELEFATPATPVALIRRYDLTAIGVLLD